jgi:pyruvate kinase
MEVAAEANLLKEGDLVIQTAGTFADVSGSTDLVKVSVVGKGTVLNPSIV